MTKTVKGAGRGRYAANKARHDQRTPFPARAVHDAHTAALREAAGVPSCARCGLPKSDHNFYDLRACDDYQ